MNKDLGVALSMLGLVILGLAGIAWGALTLSLVAELIMERYGAVHVALIYLFAMPVFGLVLYRYGGKLQNVR